MNYKNIFISYLAMGMGGATCWAFVTMSFSRLWVGFLIGCALLTLCLIGLFWREILSFIISSIQKIK